MNPQGGVTLSGQTHLSVVTPTASSGSTLLAAAVEVLAPALLVGHDHLRMLPRVAEGDNKYVTVHRAPTATDIADHLCGRRTHGGMLYQAHPLSPGSRMAHAIAYDADDDFASLCQAAARLVRRGFSPLLVRNPVDATRGHLWIVFDGPFEPARALAVVEHLSPELAATKERFPDPKSSNGGRLRWPGGRYLPIAVTPTPVLVAEGVAWGRPTWHEGTTPEGWAAIAGSVTPVGIIAATWIPAIVRPIPPQALPPHPPQARRVRVPRPTDDGFDFAAFNAANPIASLVAVDKRGYFKAPWRDERTASVHVYADGQRWKDFGPDKRGGDAFDLWCALHGHWDCSKNRPDLKAAIRALSAGKDGAA